MFRQGMLNGKKDLQLIFDWSDDANATKTWSSKTSAKVGI